MSECLILAKLLKANLSGLIDGNTNITEKIKVLI